MKKWLAKMKANKLNSVHKFKNCTWSGWRTTSVQTISCIFPIWKTKDLKVSISKYTKQHRTVYLNFSPARKRQKQDYFDGKITVDTVLRNFTNDLSFHVTKTLGLYVKFRCCAEHTHKYFPFCFPCMIRAKWFTCLLAKLQNYVLSRSEHNIQWN